MSVEFGFRAVLGVLCCPAFWDGGERPPGIQRVQCSPAELKAGWVLPGLPLEDGERARRLQGAGCDEVLSRACFW